MSMDGTSIKSNNDSGADSITSEFETAHDKPTPSSSLTISSSTESTLISSDRDPAHIQILINLALLPSDNDKKNYLQNLEGAVQHSLLAGLKFSQDRARENYRTQAATKFEGKEIPPRTLLMIIGGDQFYINFQKILSNPSAAQEQIQALSLKEKVQILSIENGSETIKSLQNTLLPTLSLGEQIKLFATESAVPPILQEKFNHAENLLPKEKLEILSLGIDSPTLNALQKKIIGTLTLSEINQMMPHLNRPQDISLDYLAVLIALGQCEAELDKKIQASLIQRLQQIFTYYSQPQKIKILLTNPCLIHPTNQQVLGDLKETIAEQLSPTQLSLEDQIKIRVLPSTEGSKLYQLQEKIAESLDSTLLSTADKVTILALPSNESSKLFELQKDICARVIQNTYTLPELIPYLQYDSLENSPYRDLREYVIAFLDPNELRNLSLADLNTVKQSINGSRVLTCLYETTHHQTFDQAYSILANNPLSPVVENRPVALESVASPMKAPKPIIGFFAKIGEFFKNLWGSLFGKSTRAPQNTTPNTMPEITLTPIPDNIIVATPSAVRQTNLTASPPVPFNLSNKTSDKSESSSSVDESTSSSTPFANYQVCLSKRSATDLPEQIA